MRWTFTTVLFLLGIMVMAEEETGGFDESRDHTVYRQNHSEFGSDCLFCHRGITPGTNSHMISSNDDCYFCHDEKQTVDQGGSSPTSLMLTYADNNSCVACHVQHDRSGQQSSAHTDLACTTCHNPHGSAFGRMFVRQEVDLCNSCHGDWDIGISHPTGSDVKDAYSGAALSCVSSCHSMHQPVESGLLQVAYSSLCARCHADKV